MSKPLVPILFAAGLGFAAGATAQVTVQSAVQTPWGPDNGYFRPAPDVSLTAPRTPAGGASAQPATTPYTSIQTGGPATIAVPVAPVATPPAAAAAPVANAAADNGAAAQAQAQLQAAERQMDRSLVESVREGNRMQQAAPTVGAAFDGTTDDRNR
jgi:hypothetical protein